MARRVATLPLRPVPPVPRDNEWDADVDTDLANFHSLPSYLLLDPRRAQLLLPGLRTSPKEQNHMRARGATQDSDQDCDPEEGLGKLFDAVKKLERRASRTTLSWTSFVSGLPWHRKRLRFVLPMRWWRASGRQRAGKPRTPT